MRNRGPHRFLPAVIALMLVAAGCASPGSDPDALDRTAARTAVQDAPVAQVTRTAPAKRATARTSRKFYVDPSSQAVAAVRAAKAAGNATTAARLRVISKAPQAKWFGPWNTQSSVKKDVATYVKAAAKAKRVPHLVLYAIPNRDCGGYSSGGLTATQYKAWIRQVAAGLKGSQSVVVLEPDSLGHTCGGAERTALLKYATGKLSAAGAWVYLDGGHSRWNSPATMARRLKAAGITKARGFATNVSNFNSTAAEKKYAKKLSAALKKRGVTASHRKYVIDTSRNGTATARGQWCNPAGQGLGPRPRWVTSGQLDAYLWIKRPGESDGECNGGPAAGQWWTSYALGLVKRKVA